VASTQPDDSYYDTVIIGCGMAGLAAGIRLAMYDRKVLIVERHNAPGGLNSFYFLHGRKFDVGLHAVTNCSSPEVKGTPMAKLLRQLRLTRDDFQLAPQCGSRIAFPETDLKFSNDFSLLESEVASVFPASIDGFRALRRAILGADAFNLQAGFVSARAQVAEHISDPLLQDMLFCPIMYYGSSTEDDMDWSQFVIMWKALFEEGFGRPLEGVRVIIRALLNRYRALGGERRMRCGVRRILVQQGRAHGVELDDGTRLRCDHILSTAGWSETLRLCEDQSSAAGEDNVGRLSFVETITVLDAQPATLGCNDTIVFFNDSGRFAYRQPQAEVDPRSGVICFPNNYQYPEGQQLPEGLLRITAMARHSAWQDLPEEEYLQRKQFWYDQLLQSALRFLPNANLDEVRRRTVATDMFTPRTITHFTGHLAGAIYGSVRKLKDGQMHLPNLYLAGTDQGFLGITGAMLSGISMANMHILQPR
jgi:phytoene dehydrogenase-like protein